MNKLFLVNSIFRSINGECCKWGQGSWAVFVRMYGCSASCSYCDTKYASGRNGGNAKILSIEDIEREVLRLGGFTKRVVITGGEPTEQEYLIDLLKALISLDYEISIETNGVNIEIIRKLILLFPEVSLVVDYKLPSAGQVSKKMMDETYYNLLSNSFIKFVISTYGDFKIALDVITRLSKKTSAKFYFSSCGLENVEKLFQWMKNEPIIELLDVNYNYQIHKNIFGKDWRDEEK
jgi:7-carboxy-7-deazaguanine synthase